MLKVIRANPQKAVLNFNVNIHFGRESEIRENLDWGRFYLLNESIIEIFKKLDLNAEKEDGAKYNISEQRGANLEAGANILMTLTRDINLGNLSGYGAGDNPKYAETGAETLLVGYLLKEQIEAHSIKIFEFDRLNSTVRFNRHAGKFHLFGFGTLGEELFVWEQSSRLLPGENTLEFDQYNAEVVTGFCD